MRVVINSVDKREAINTIEKYISDIYVDDKGELDNLPYAKDMLSDILIDLGIEEEQ